VKDDFPTLNSFQNIIKDGGVCGRRAFFGRFILRSFGIPVWGVTQHAHAALSHWTPKGWVVNLGAGFEHSWWDKSDAPLGGADFLLETKARKHAQDYLKVLRAQWVSQIEGEPAYNGRKKVPGGTWSSLAHYAEMIIASNDADLGPLGSDLAEANESAASAAEAVAKATITPADQKIVTDNNGAITIPAAACTGKNQLVNSFLGGQQLICDAPVTCVVDVRQPGKYTLSARIVTVHDESHAQLTTTSNKDPVDVVIPYTVGKWQNTKPVEITLVQGKNEINLNTTSKMALKDLTLTPAN
jgi:hypothetical protein